MNEQLENLFDTVTTGEWGNNQGTEGGIDTGVIRSANFTKDHKFNSKEIVVRSIEQRKRQKKLLSHGDIIIEKSGGSPDQPVGRVLFYDLEGEHTCSNFISILRPARQADPKFLYYSLCNLYERGVVKNYQQQTTGIINLQLGEYLRESIFFPPLPEQKKIAEILSGIDRQTQLLQKGIQAKQNLRSALLSETITEDAPMSKLDSVASRVSGHTPSKSHPEYWNGGIPWVSLTDTSNLDNRYISHTAKHISEEGIKNSSAVLHPPGLVILSRDARVGCSAITTKSMAVSQHFIGWICSEKLLNKYLYYLLQKWKPRFEAIAMGSTIPTIGVPFFRDLEIPVPPMQTQERVAMTLESVDSEISALSNKVAMLRVLKSGVSSDLLSGRKRVSV